MSVVVAVTAGWYRTVGLSRVGVADQQSGGGDVYWDALLETLQHVFGLDS